MAPGCSGGSSRQDDHHRSNNVSLCHVFSFGFAIRVSLETTCGIATLGVVFGLINQLYKDKLMQQLSVPRIVLCYKCRDLPPLIQANFDPVDMSTNGNHFILFSDFIKQKMQQQLSIMWLP
jgi:hypothetical protein